MKPLIVLLLATAISYWILWFLKKDTDWQHAARIGMSVMLLFTALGHFMFPDGMSKMIPSFLPQREFLVYATGIIEIAAAFGLQIKRFRKLTGWLLILFFILVLPANIKASLEYLNYQTGVPDGPGPAYLWFRIPLQILFIVWVYFSAVRKLQRHSKV